MKKQFQTAALCSFAVAGVIAVPAVAQFGFSIVSDPGAYARMATELQQAIREYEALVTLYQLSQQAYSNMVRAAQNITTKNVWMPPVTSWTYPSASNTYGTTAGWTRAINSGGDAGSGYNSATVSLQNYSRVWPSLSAAQQDQLGRRYGSVELTDAAAINAMNQVGRIRDSAAGTDVAIGRLAADAASNAQELNTEVGVLNQVSAAGVINARQQQSTNELLATMVDQQTVQAKMTHDALAEGISLSVAAKQAAEQNTTAIWGGTTQALRVRLP
ncbi:MAG TPA: hypothetical protein VNH18_28050 [Bryobacteraceae bacterium]|nr:hypothetical protein [Bryobacteraceae bacterium]